MKKRIIKHFIVFEDYEKAIKHYDLLSKIKSFNKKITTHGAHPLTMSNYEPRTNKFWH